MTVTRTGTAAAAEVELAIGGMTCASCAARVEKKLNRMEGVTATVNYATEKAKVSYTDEVSVQDLIATVEATGYTAREPAPPTPPTRADADGPDGPDTAPPAWATASVLDAAVRTAVAAVSVDTARPDGTVLELRFGAQVDVRTITTTDQTDDGIGEEALAGYVAKYATKGTGKSEAADRPIRTPAPRRTLAR